MIPLRDTIPTRRFPIVNTALIGLNVLAFLFEAILTPDQLDSLIQIWGLVPTRFWQAGGLGGWLPLFTSMFLHGGWWHLISNMLALYIFGDNVEDRLGHLRYLLFYLLGGLVAGGAHLLANSGSPIPTVGASGAIAAVLGAYLVLYPRVRCHNATTASAMTPITAAPVHMPPPDFVVVVSLLATGVGVG